MNDETLTAREVAAVLKVDVKTIYRWTAQNLIPAMRFGRTYRYDLEAVKRSREPKPAGAWAQSPRSRGRKRAA